ncbi:MAG: DNA-binding protein [Oscillochloris sp.]|nr:DNA-binding protein [Oscillochloris sp.]
MNVREISWSGGRGLVVVFAKGDEFMAGMKNLASTYQLSGASFSGIGAFSTSLLGFFDRSRMEYVKIPVDEQVEVLTLAGNIALNEGKPKIHPHVVLGKIDGSTVGGHILEAHVWPTLEVIIHETPTTLQRHTDPETGLALLNI